MRNPIFRVALGVAFAVALSARAPTAAHANGPGIQLFAGLSSGGVQRVSFDNTDCIRCMEFSVPAARSLDGPVYTFAFGLGGTEGRFRGGAEVMGMIGSGAGVTGGYTGLLTYAGFEIHRTIALAGVGVGIPWITDGDRWGRNLEGNVHLRIGVRVTRKFVLVTRGDLLRDSRLGSVVSAGLEWSP